MPGQAKHPFDYHRPSDVQVQDIAAIRSYCKLLYEKINELLAAGRMEGRCSSLAKTKLEEVSMWANKGIVLADEGPVEEAPALKILETPNADRTIELMQRLADKTGGIQEEVVNPTPYDPDTHGKWGVQVKSLEEIAARYGTGLALEMGMQADLASTPQETPDVDDAA